MRAAVGRLGLRSTATLQLGELLSVSSSAAGLHSTCGSTAQAAGGASCVSTDAPNASAVLQPGADFTLKRIFSGEEVAAFTALTGDSNPIHTSQAAAAQRGLPAPVLPGIMMASLFPAIIGSHFPGALYLSQTLKFRAHALVGDCLEAKLTVERSSGSRVLFRTLCYSRDAGQVLVEGTALALIRPEDRVAHGAQKAQQETAGAADCTENAEVGAVSRQGEAAAAGSGRRLPEG